jgi:hypothetical protein
VEQWLTPLPVPGKRFEPRPHWEGNPKNKNLLIKEKQTALRLRLTQLIAGPG